MGWARKKLRQFDKAVIRPILNTVEAVIEDPKKLAMVAISVLAPGAGTALGSAMGLGTGTAATVVGQAAINTALNGGDLKAGIIAAAIPVVGKELAGTAADAFIKSGMDKALAESAGKVVAGTGIAAAQGKDPLSALISGGLSEGTAAITRDIPGFSDLPEAAKKSINAAVATELAGGDGTQAAVNAAMNVGITSLANYTNSLNQSTGVDKSTVGNFEDTEITRLKNMGYTKDQINAYFGILDNLTEVFDEPQEPLPVEGGSAATRSLGTDPVKALEDAGLTQKADDNVLIAGKSDKTLALPEHDYNPIDDYFKPTKSIEELLVTGKSEKETPAETPTYSPIDDYFKPTKGVEELLVTGNKDKTQEHVFDPTFGGTKPITGTDLGEIEIVGKRPDERPPLPLDVDPITMAPVPVELPTLPSTTTTPGAPKAPTAAKPATPTASSGMNMLGLMALLNGQQQPMQQAPMQDPYAHIKLMEDLFGSNIDLTPAGDNTTQRK